MVKTYKKLDKDIKPASVKPEKRSILVDDQPVHIALLGSSRFDYAYIIPMMKYIRTLIKEIVE